MDIPCVSLRHRHHGPNVYVDLKLEVNGGTTATEMEQVRNGSEDDG